MPSSSKKQHNFMAAVAHSPSFAKKVGVPQRVGKDFTKADKGKTMANKYSVPKGKNAAEWWSANETGAVKPGEKSYLPPKKTPPKAPPKTKKFDEGGATSDEDTVSENAKKNMADAEVAKSKAEDAKGKLNTSNKRGFFGSLFSGKIKEYNAEHKRNRDLQSTFGGMKSAATMDAEKKRDSVGKGIDLDPSELKVGPDTDARGAAMNAMRMAKNRLRKRQRQNQNQGQDQSQEAPKQEESKGESFSSWFRKQKTGSTGTWTNPKTGEKKRIFIDRGGSQGTTSKAKTATAPAKKDDSKPSTSSAPRSVGDVERDLRRQRRESNTQHVNSRATRIKPAAPISSNTPATSRGGKTGTFRLDKNAKRSAPKKQVINASRGQWKYEDKKSAGGRGQKFCGGGATKAYRSGGLVSSRADGIASRGRTRCKIV